MSFSNGDKSKHGKDMQYSLDKMLQMSREESYVSDYTTKYRIGKQGFSNTEQFYAPFVITFNDGTEWALYTTTSMRTDRIKGQQWDAINLKELNHNIKRVYVVYPDDVDDDIKRGFLSQNKKYLNREEFSAIDEIVSQDEIVNKIEEYAIKGKTPGQIKDLQGNSFESRVATLLSYDKNLFKWKSDDPTIEGMHYDLFRLIVSCFNLDAKQIKSILATSNKAEIGKLPSGGNPKTDVLVTVYYENGGKEYFTISCKRSSEKSVSVHQYNADAFANVLDRNNAKLRRLLTYFQYCGSIRDFGDENTDALTKELKPYTDRLIMWALSGHGGEGNSKQNADYILTYDNNSSSSSMHRIEEYCRLLKLYCTRGHFGTPFQWTYPSKRKGKDIQLKCTILK